MLIKINIMINFMDIMEEEILVEVEDNMAKDVVEEIVKIMEIIKIIVIQVVIIGVDNNKSNTILKAITTRCNDKIQPKALLNNNNLDLNHNQKFFICILNIFMINKE